MKKRHDVAYRLCSAVFFSFVGLRCRDEPVYEPKFNTKHSFCLVVRNDQGATLSPMLFSVAVNCWSRRLLLGKQMADKYCCKFRLDEVRIFETKRIPKHFLTSFDMKHSVLTVNSRMD